MNILTTWNEDIGYFKRFFSPHEVRLATPELLKKGEIDLLIVPGGIVDIHPSAYKKEFPADYLYSNNVNPERDAQELDILMDVLREKLQVKKVLGICRGLQLINVLMRGNLCLDIESSYGRQHTPVHPIRWIESNVLEKITQVNSVHHQSVRTVGTAIRALVLGIEPATRIPEAVLWGDKYLGLQFHPEYYSSGEDRDFIRDIILKWVTGEINILKTDTKSSAYKVNLIDFPDYEKMASKPDWMTGTLVVPDVEEDDDEKEEDDDEMEEDY